MHADRARLQRVLDIIMAARQHANPDEIGDDTETIGDVLREYERRWGASKDSMFTVAAISAESAYDLKIDGLVPAILKSGAPYLSTPLLDFERIRIELLDM